MPGRLRRRADPLHAPPAGDHDTPAPARGAPDSVLDLQCSAGNAAVVRLLRSGGGAPLDRATREDMQARFGGADFSAVRVHAGPAARTSAEELGAEAYTVGSDIVLRRSALDAGSAHGRHLLAHELTHVLQQRGAPSGGELAVSDPADRFERQAAATADRVAAGGAAATPAASGAVVQREPTKPRAVTGSASITDLETQTANLGPGRVTAGQLAKAEWESLFTRHFVEPDQVEDEVESSHARYLYSKMYGWIDAQHFFAHIQFAEDAGPAKATSEGLAIEGKQARVRGMIGPDPDDTSIYSDLLEHNLINADDFLHYREATFMAISAAMSFFLNAQQRALVAGFDDRQIAKLILDNAMSAWSYEDLASNQLGVQFFRLHGAFVNAGADAAEVRRRFVERLRSFFADIQVVQDPAAVRRLAASLPGKERWTSPKTDETTARKKFPELFALGAGTHRIRVATYDREKAAASARDQIKGKLPSLTLRIEPYGSGFALYAGPVSHFEAVVGKNLIDRVAPTGPGGALVEDVKSRTP